ncbi:MAG: hypothetical protein ABEI98_02315 [Halorhabdus sp.]
MGRSRCRAVPIALLVIVVLGGCLAPVSTPDGISSTPGDGSAETSDRTENSRFVSDGTSTSGDPIERQSQQQTDKPADAGAAETTATVPDSRSGPRLAEPISTNATLDRSEITFYPDNATIRYVAAYRHTNHEAVVNGTATPECEPVYEFVPVGEWLAVEAPYAGADAVHERVTSRLAGNHSLSTGVSSTENGTRVTVATRTLLSRDGEVSRPRT